MDVLVDGYWLVSGPPSGRHVVRSLLDTWSREHPDDQLTVVVPFDDRTAAASELGSRVALRPTRLRPHGAAVTALSARGFDAVVTQNFTPVLGRGARRATFVHDLLFVEHPDWFTSAERAYLGLLSATVGRAEVVLTSSAAEAGRIARLRPDVAARVRAVGLAVPRSFAAAQPAPSPLAAAHRDGFLLAVGRLNVRKNLDRLAEALLRHELISPTRPLAVVGAEDGRAALGSAFARGVAEGSIVLLGPVGDSELKWLYAHCSVFVFPSLDEGFGLPILEARSQGAPIACSDIAPFRELDADASFFDPADPDAIAAAVRCARAAPRRATPSAQEPTWSGVVSAVRDVVAPREGDSV